MENPLFLDISPENISAAILEKLNEPQREAVTFGEGPLLVFAGAGSGKTRVITRRIAWLVAHGVHPAEILALTFTNKAANEMKERLSSLLGQVANRMWVGTFHSMLLRVLRPHAEKLGFTSSFSIIDTDDQKNLIKQVMKELNIDTNTMRPAEVRNYISGAKNRMLGPEEYLASLNKSYSGMGQIIYEVYLAYQKALKEQNSMDFDDILLFSVKLFREYPEVLHSYSERFRHILVDEYQDTNMVQYTLVKMLSSVHQNICVVGDDDQSIYSFRGANHENILNFERDFPSAHVVKLEQNYRSTSIILGAANAVISNNEERADKNLWTAKKGGEKIQFYRASDHYDEARWIAREIKRLSIREEGAISYSEIGILYRINALSRNLEFALREEGIPYNIYGGLRFYDRMEIRDVFAYLRLITTPQDRLAFERVINTPKRGIGDTTVGRVLEHAENYGKTAMEVAAEAFAYDDLSHAAAKLQSFSDLIVEMREVAQQDELSFAEFIAYVEDRSGILTYWQAEQKRGNLEAEARVQNLRELISDAVEFEARQREELLSLAEIMERYGDDAFTRMLYEDAQGELPEDLKLMNLLSSFLDNAALFSVSDEEAQQEAVSLMTIHSAKGLEFDAGFVLGVEDGIFPNMQNSIDKKAKEEERRLFYVAITRARKRLSITAAQNRLIYGQTSYNPPSCFLREIPSELLEETGGSRFGDGENTFIRQEDSVSINTPSRNLFSRRVGSFTNKRKNQKILGNAADKKHKLMSLKPGAQLSHKRFGEGKLIKIEIISNGADALLSIDFNGTLKHMTAAMADLDII